MKLDTYTGLLFACPLFLNKGAPMKNNKNEEYKNTVKSMPTEAEILHAAKVGMPMPNKNDAIEQGINNREYGVQYGIDANTEHLNKNETSVPKKNESFSGDPSEMRKAPGYTESVPGVNTPNIRLPGAEMKQDVSVPAFNPPVPNRAWTAMKKGLDIEQLSEEEKRDLYVGRDRYF